MDNFKIKDLKRNDHVLFKFDPYQEGVEKYYSGHVINVYGRFVSVSYLCGYKSLDDMIPYDNMIAKFDAENGVEMEFDKITGKSVLLEP